MRKGQQQYNKILFPYTAKSPNILSMRDEISPKLNKLQGIAGEMTICSRWH